MSLGPMRIAFVANTDWYLYNFRSGLALHLKEQGIEVRMICPDGPFRPRLEALGFRWHPLPLSRRGVNPFREYGTYRHLRELYREIRPDLVHHFTLQCVVWGSLAASREGVPSLVNALTGMGSLFHGGSLLGRLLRWPVRNLLRTALTSKGSRTIFQNPDDLRICQSWFGLAPERLHLIRGSGVDIARFTPVPRDLRAPVILYVGRLLRDKGILDFVEAAARLGERRPDWRFEVAGTPDPGNPSSLTETDITTLKARHPNLTFLGHQEDMPGLFGRAHLVVLPSRYGEGVPRSLIEAAAAGLPLLATDHPGCREIVRHGENGLLVPAEDPGALARAMESILENPARWEAFAARGREIAVEGFSSDSVFPATLQVYQLLTSN